MEPKRPKRKLSPWANSEKSLLHQAAKNKYKKQCKIVNARENERKTWMKEKRIELQALYQQHKCKQGKIEFTRARHGNPLESRYIDHYSEITIRRRLEGTHPKSAQRAITTIPVRLSWVTPQDPNGYPIGYVVMKSLYTPQLFAFDTYGAEFGYITDKNKNRLEKHGIHLPKDGYTGYGRDYTWISLSDYQSETSRWICQHWKEIDALLEPHLYQMAGATVKLQFTPEQKQWMKQLTEWYANDHKLPKESVVLQTVINEINANDDVKDGGYNERWINFMIWLRKYGRFATAVKGNPNWKQQLEQDDSRAEFVGDFSQILYNIIGKTRGKPVLKIIFDEIVKRDKGSTLSLAAAAIDKANSAK